MKVLVKEPGAEPELREVAGISEINKLVGNVDKNGNGYPYGDTDIRMSVADGLDMYVKEDAIYNLSLPGNLWTPDDRAVLCGTVAFAGYSHDNSAERGACSLTPEQVDYCLTYIAKQAV